MSPENEWHSNFYEIPILNRSIKQTKIERVRKQNGVETTIMRVAKITSNCDWNSL